MSFWRDAGLNLASVSLTLEWFVVNPFPHLPPSPCFGGQQRKPYIYIWYLSEIMKFRDFSCQHPNFPVTCRHMVPFFSSSAEELCFSPDSKGFKISWLRIGAERKLPYGDGKSFLSGLSWEGQADKDWAWKEQSIWVLSGIPTGSTGFRIIFAFSGVGMLGVSLVSHSDLFLFPFSEQFSS